MREKKHFLIKHGTILVVTIIIAMLSSGLTANTLHNPIIRTFNLIKGYGFTPDTYVEVDDQGIAVVIYPPPIGRQYNPVTISQKAFEYWEQYCNGDEGSKQLFLNTANWLVENATSRGEYVVWEYQFPWPIYNMRPPWVSAMAQGKAIQVLIRAYSLTSETKYLATAEQALRAFYHEVHEGGVTYKDSEEAWWYEEYADVGGRESRVLNGMIFALLGIHEFYEYTDDEEAKRLFDRGIHSLKNSLSDYDSGRWTYYNALGSLASEKYHRLHVNQLKQLYEITQDSYFLAFHDRWQSYSRWPFFIREFIILHPNELDIVIVAINIIGVLGFIELGAFVLKGIRVRRERGGKRGEKSKIGVRTCMLVLNEFTHDARILREAQALVKAGYDVSVFALHKNGLPERERVNGVQVRRIRLSSRRLPRTRAIQLIKFTEYALRAIPAIRKMVPSICHCHDLYALPIAYLIAKWDGVKLIYDSHELESAFPNPTWFRWISRQLEHFLIKRVDKVITVSDSIANEMVKQDSIKKPAVIRNMPEYVDMTGGNRIKEVLGIAEDKRIVLYQGALRSDRGLDRLIKAMRLVSSNSVLVLIGSGEAETELRELVKTVGLETQVRFMGRVPYDELLSYTSSADIGVHAIPNLSLNNYYSLPNKLFEYIMAELPVAVSNFPEMSKIVEQYGVGVVFDPEDVKDIARAINELLEDREKYARMKENTKRAKKVLNWENESRKLLEIYEQI